MDKTAPRTSHEMPDHSERWTGVQTDSAQLATNPARVRPDRTISEQRYKGEKSLS